jgi:hypothetical protein
MVIGYFVIEEWVEEFGGGSGWSLAAAGGAYLKNTPPAAANDHPNLGASDQLRSQEKAGQAGKT